MKAAAYHRDGEPDVLTYQDVADPDVGPTTVLIRVAHMTRAASGELTMPVERSFLVAEAGEAHALAERARPLGRVLLDMEGAA